MRLMLQTGCWMFKEKDHGLFKNYCKGPRAFMFWITCTIEVKSRVPRATSGTRVGKHLTAKVIVSLPQKHC
jgi:hypothetical protein